MLLLEARRVYPIHSFWNWMSGKRWESEESVVYSGDHSKGGDDGSGYGNPTVASVCLYATRSSLVSFPGA